MSIQLEDYKGKLILGRRGHWQVCEMWNGGLLSMITSTPLELPKRKTLTTCTTKAEAKKFIDKLVNSK